jgi:Bifunctional DNA primase/polymerase, N-terminal/Primase C terminal 2 (PriCT-2)
MEKRPCCPKGEDMKNDNDKLDAALEYVRQGWEVFPCPPGLKCGYSIESRGFDNKQPWGKTTSVKEVRAYWKKLPHANIGVPMGIGSGIWDLEIDTKEGHPNLKKDGAISLAELEAKHGKLPATLTFVSPTGSVHRLFRHPSSPVPLHDEMAEATVRIRSGTLDVNYPGIDCKGDGSISVMPPSKTRKGVYRWTNKRRIARAPQWLLTMVIKQEYAPRESDPFAQFAKHIRPMNMAKFTLAVAMVPNPDLPWDPDKDTGNPGWNATGMAIFAATDGSAEGFKLFNALSRRSRAKYSAANTRAKWEAFHGCPPREIGAGTIFRLAEKAVPDWQERICAREPKVIALLEEFLKLRDAP